jgi:hypothetical protein
MPKSVVELVTANGTHVAWVEIRASERPQHAAIDPVVLLWGSRCFTWITVNLQGFHVFAEALTIVSHTPSPGLLSPDGAGPAPLGIVR